MTSPNVTEVATDQLVTYARRRFEDSYACHAVMTYILDMADVPRWAWSHLPWSDQWHRGWVEAWEHRVTEAKTIRDEHAATAGKLMRVAADYAETEHEITLTFRVQGEPLLRNQDTGWYLGHFTREPIRFDVAPGGAPPEPIFPQRPPPPPSSWKGRFGVAAEGGVAFPSGNDQLQRFPGREPPGRGHAMAEQECGRVRLPRQRE